MIEFLQHLLEMIVDNHVSIWALGGIAVAFFALFLLSLREVVSWFAKAPKIRSDMRSLQNKMSEMDIKLSDLIQIQTKLNESHHLELVTAEEKSKDDEFTVSH